MDIQTRCIHGPGRRPDQTGAIAAPIYQTATFAHPGVGQSTGYDYSRSGNPTRERLEETVAALEEGAAALGFASGMAAIAALMELFRPGDHLVVSADLYGGTHRIFDTISAKNGIAFTSAATTAEMRAAVTPRSRAVFIETPTNPLMQVTDIAAVAALCREKSLLLVVDNTFLSPYLQRPLSLGADIVVHSGTKYLGGHNDTLAGFLVARDDATAEQLRFIAKTTGGCLAPLDSFLILRGIKTLAVRMERQQQTAAQIARWLCGQAAVTKVYYPGLPDHPGHEVSRRQADGFGAMLSFSVGDEAAAVRALERVRLIQYAESLGGTESLITYPLLQTHADIPEERRLTMGIDSRLLRLSVGLEAADDLIADLDQALNANE